MREALGESEGADPSRPAHDPIDGAQDGPGEESAGQSDGDEDRRRGGEEEPSGGAEGGPRIVEGAGDLDGVGLSPHLDRGGEDAHGLVDRKSTRLNSSHVKISYAV